MCLLYGKPGFFTSKKYTHQFTFCENPINIGIYMIKKEEKNKQILNSATTEFLSKGLDAASMHHIAEQAEVSKRTLYKYYSNKEDLYCALVDEILDRVDDMYSFNYSTQNSIQEQIERIVDAKIELTLTDSFLQINKIVLGELLKGRMPNEQQMLRLNKSEATFVEWIEQAQKEDKILNDISAHTIAEQFHSILKGQIYWPVLLGMKEKSSLDIKQVRDTTVNFFINSFCKK